MITVRERRMKVLGRLDLLNTLNDLSNAINTVELLIKENVPVGKDLMERLKVLVHNVMRENGV